MNILITGGTGFIGVELITNLIRNNYNITVLTRQLNKSSTNKAIKFVNNTSQIKINTKFDTIINHAGARIDKRWSKNYKNILVNSRISVTKDIIKLIKILDYKPRLLISASGIGYYGIHSEAPLDENSSYKECFTNTLCSAWENEAIKAINYGTRVCITRFGVVLGKTGGALKKMIPIFKMGMGGEIGSGLQPFSWVHINDVINIFKLLIINERLTGIFNVTSPEPVTNKIFTKTLGTTLGRPTLFTLPPFFIKTIFGEMGESILLNGLHVIPNKLIKSGYKFEFPKIGLALENILMP